MATASKTRIRKTTTSVPQSRAEAAQAIARIGKLQGELDAIDSELEARILELKRAKSDRIETLRKERNTVVTGLFSFAQAHRQKLLGDSGVKSVAFPTGTIAWRYSPPAVAVDDDAEMIEMLKELGLDCYVRTKEELDRESLLRDRETVEVEGLDFTQREDFIVTPTEHCSEVKKSRTIVLD